jgi:hypothetical protein
VRDSGGAGEERGLWVGLVEDREERRGGRKRRQASASRPTSQGSFSQKDGARLKNYGDTYGDTYNMRHI